MKLLNYDDSRQAIGFLSSNDNVVSSMAGKYCDILEHLCSLGAITTYSSAAKCETNGAKLILEVTAAAREAVRPKR
jgi:hypothetical protein